MPDGGYARITIRDDKITAKIAKIQASLQEKLTPVYEQEAERLQVSQQEALKERIQGTGRPQTRSNFLVEAIVSPANRNISKNGFTVGEGVAVSEAGPYFRMIDQGSDKFVHRTLLGWFLDEGGRRMPPRPGAKDAGRLIQLKKQEPIPRGGGLRNTKSQFRSLKLKEGEAAHEPRVGSGAFVIHINHPIPRYNYIRGGLERWIQSGGKRRIETAIKNAARRAQ